MSSVPRCDMKENPHNLVPLKECVKVWNKEQTRLRKMKIEEILLLKNEEFFLI